MAHPRKVTDMKRAGYRGSIAIDYVPMDWKPCNRNDHGSEAIQCGDFLCQAATL
jgi:hypothetical protein